MMLRLSGYYPGLILGAVIWSCVYVAQQLNTPGHVDQQNKCDVLSSKTMLDKRRYVNMLVTDYDADIRARMERVQQRKATSDDPELIALIRDLLDPPSKHMIKTVKTIGSTNQSREIIDVLKGMKGPGFFVEAGGLDGELQSNTLWLEQNKGWTGLLIEMDPYFYTQLRGKNRRCWTINACISPVDRPTMLHINESPRQGGSVNITGSSGLSVPCFTLESLLAALNTSTVDYFSLDVEGFEMEVLQTIDLDRVDIKTMSVEYLHIHVKTSTMIEYMNSRGYRLHKKIYYHNSPLGTYVDDFIFVKEN